MKKTKIICSVGPACMDEKIMSSMVLSGMNCARINMSHSKYEDCFDVIKLVRSVRKSTGLPVAIMYDTKGPEFRLLDVKDGVILKENDEIYISKKEVLGTKEEVSVNHPEAIDYIKVGDHVLIDNALMDLLVIEHGRDYIKCRVLNGGELKSHKTINVPGVNLYLPFISEQDREDITFAATHSADYIALSFVSCKQDVEAARKLVKEAGGDALLISKIESRTGVENIDSIIKASDGIMVARGDLGVEVPMEELPILQKMMIRKCREQGKFAIVATEMLASMYENIRPTRAEVSDIANAVLDGTDCVMLSGETTVGKHPIEAVRYMASISEKAEEAIDYNLENHYISSIKITDTIAKCVVDAINYDDIKCVVATTMTGYTARKISNLRPGVPIIALCPSNHIAESIALNFGVLPVVVPEFSNIEDIVELSKRVAKEELKLEDKDLIIVTGGFPLGKSHATNMIRIEEI